MKPRMEVLSLSRAGAPAAGQPASLRGPVELGETTIFPGAHCENEGVAEPSLPRTVITLHDLHAFPRGVAENSFHLCEGLFRYRPSVEEELLVRAGKMTGDELAQELLVNVFLHRASCAPGKAPAD